MGDLIREEELIIKVEEMGGLVEQVEALMELTREVEEEAVVEVGVIPTMAVRNPSWEAEVAEAGSLKSFHMKMMVVVEVEADFCFDWMQCYWQFDSQ